MLAKTQHFSHRRFCIEWQDCLGFRSFSKHIELLIRINRFFSLGNVFLLYVRIHVKTNIEIYEFFKYLTIKLQKIFLDTNIAFYIFPDV